MSSVSLLCLIIFVPQLSPNCVENVRLTSTEFLCQALNAAHISKSSRITRVMGKYNGKSKENLRIE